MSEDKIQSAKEKIACVRFLPYFVKEYGSLESLAEKLNSLSDEENFSIADISRYINRKALPTERRKDIILQFINSNLSPSMLIAERVRGVRFHETYFIDTRELLSDTATLENIAFLVTKTILNPSEYDLILTVEVDGIPFAMSLASSMEIPMIYARRKPPLSLGEYISRDVPKIEQRRIDTYYLQKHEINKGARILIVDDIIRTARTQQALIEMVSECGGITGAVLALIGIEDEETLKKRLEASGTRDQPVNVYLLHRF
ncbi:MAG: phosphoribosyltransferase family protein [Candidatus Odinarchaeota archaeon]